MHSPQASLRRPARSILLAVLAAVAAPAAVRAQAPALVRPGAGPASWLDADADFRVENGRVFGPWRRSAEPAVVYFTGPFAQKHKSFFEVGEKAAARVNGRFREIHKEHVLPSADDENGILLFPDGTARAMLFLMPGGNAAFTMGDLAGISNPQSAQAMVAERAKFAEARRRPFEAFRTGMNYVGACGGFFSATSGYDVPRALHTGWGIWPGKVANIGPGRRTPFPDVVFEGADPEHPLVKAAKGGRLRDMYYNGGPIGVRDGAPDTEYFGRYRGGNMPELEGDWFLVAHKPADNPASGRVVIATGHPEVNHRDYLMAMALYAMDHEVETPVRPLEFGRPSVGVVGDEQLLYFRVTPPGAGRLTVTLADLGENCDLYVRAGRPPTPRKFDAKSAAPGTAGERIVHSLPRAGDVYIAVHGKHSVLNGARFALTAKWE